MKRVLILLLFVVGLHSLYAQYYIVRDDDGYVNVRDANKKIVNQVNSNAIVTYEMGGDEAGTENYTFVYFEKRDARKPTHDQTGYIHDSRLLELNNLPEIPLISSDSTFAFFRDKGIEINVKFKKPNPDDYKVEFDEFGNYVKTLVKKSWWCSFPYLPASVYDSIEIRIGSKTVNIPYSDLQLFEQRDASLKAYQDISCNRIYLCVDHCTSNASDFDSVLWVVENGKYKTYYRYR